jgi:two-component system, OmpR family, alkaline phosphatase synthesis response regulator PhoP
MSSKILVVEDDAEVMDLIRTALSFKEYTSAETSSGGNAVQLAMQEKPDLVILDLALPDMDGLEVCRRLKAEESTKNIPVIMLTARDSVSDIVRGLEAGANDYVTKPFEVMELMARVRAQIRLAEDIKGPPQRLEREGLVLDSFHRTVESEGRVVKDLTEKEFGIFYQLVWHSPRIMNRQEIFESVWKTSYRGQSRTIDVHVQRIRSKLGPRVAQRLVSVKGKGYKFV